MSQVQNAIGVLPVALATAVCLLFMTVFIVTARRKVSRLQKDFKRLSADVKGLQVAEQRRFLVELKATKKLKTAKSLKATNKQDDPTSMAALGDVGGETLRLVAGKEAIRP